MQWIIFIGGGVFSLFLDRMWRMLERSRESKIKVRVLGGEYEDVRGIQGLTFSITNLSALPLPDYDIILFHPQKGSLNIFDSNSIGELAPDQEREHRAPVLRGGQPTESFHWFEFYGHQKSDNPSGKGILFRLQMKNSKRVLYENAAMGEALGNIIINGVRVKNLALSPFTEWMKLQDADKKYKAEQQEIINRIHAESQRKAS